MQRRLSEFITPAVDARAGAVAKRGLEADPVIAALDYDSRRVVPGSLYFALPGAHADGHAFIAQAVAKGAVAVVHGRELAEYLPGVAYLQVSDPRFAMSPIADAFWDAPSRRLGVIGVTGTEGKSTTVYLIAQLLELAGRRAGFVSTVQHKVGAAEEWNPEHQTTPEAPTVQAALAAMRAAGLEYAVIEASSHGLSPRTNRLGDVAFDVGVMTNVTHEHLEFHGSWEQYRTDKANLFRGLDAVGHDKLLGGAAAADAAVRIPAFGVVNADDPSAAYFAAATDRRSYTFSVCGADADLSVKSVVPDAAGNSYEILVRATGEKLAVRDKLPGAFNAGNVLAALLTVSGLTGKSVAELAPLVASFRPVRGRMTAIDRGQPFEVIVDYAHTPSSFQAVLPSLKKRLAASGGRLISLFGSGGERDRAKRPLQGRLAADYSDVVVLSDEDPRGEVPIDLLEEIAAGCPELPRGERLYLIPDRPTAIRRAFALARPGDAVLLLGKGHENSIIYADKTMPYDEIAEAEAALAELGYGATL
jgi:UDP-N-acetylmuramoyl-L-alanyl-D-glutamate--2,6-diaminopimelate ligase